MSKKMFSRERERGKLRFSALLILIGLLLFGCDPTMVTITYNANGGKGEMKPQAVESGFEVKLNANTFTKDGSDFTGWNEAADGSGKAYADGATVTPTGNLTLYAQWQVKSTPENPGTEDPGTEDPVVLENHITNLALIHVVEETYKLKNDNAEIGWTKTAEGYVDMTNETNKTLVEGVTSLAPNGDMYLNGIEYFTGLQELRLLNNSVLTELPDLTRLSNLRTLAVTTFESEADSESTAVSSLTAVSGLPSSLVTLDLSENKLTELDVSKLTKLEELDLSENKLTAISDLPVSLKRLKLYTNKLTTLNVSKLTDLTYLDVSDNELTELDITNNAQLTLLLCFNNRMTALDITNVTAFSQAPLPSTSILACGLQRNDNGTLTLTATQEQQTALAPLFPPEGTDEGLDGYQLSNFNVVWDVPKAELELTEGTAVFEAGRGLKLPFTVVNTGALTQEELTQLLANATKKVTLFTADNETGTPVEDSHISHGVDTAADVSTPYILVAAAAFQSESETTYSKIEVVLQAEGYVTQTLTYAEVSVNSEPETFGISEGEASYHADTGLTLNLTLTEGWSWPEGLDVTVSVQEGDANATTAVLDKDANTIVLESSAVTEGSNTYTATLSAFGYTNLQLSWANVEIDKTAPLQILGVSFDRTAAGTSVTANWTLPEGHDIVKVVFTELVGNGNVYTEDDRLTEADHIKDKPNGIYKEFPITGDDVTSGVIDGLTAGGHYWFMVHTEDAAGNKSVRARDSVAGDRAPNDNGFMVRFTSSQLNTGAPYIENATGYFDGTHYIFEWDNPNGYDVKIAKKGAGSVIQDRAPDASENTEGIVEWKKDGDKKIGAKVKLNPVENSYNFRLMVYNDSTISANTPDTTNDFQAFCLFYFPEDQPNVVTPAN